jgi:ankyrin repeat protein
LHQLHFVFQNNTTALIVSASKGKLYFVRELINHGADVNAEDAVSNYQIFAVYVNLLLVKTLCIMHVSIAIWFY